MRGRCLATVPSCLAVLPLIDRSKQGWPGGAPGRAVFFGGSPRPRCAPACARRAFRLLDGVARSRSSVPRSAGIPALLEQRGRARTRVGSRHESRSQHARPSLELDSKPEREMNGSHVCQGRLELPRPTRPGRSASEGGGYPSSSPSHMQSIRDPFRHHHCQPVPGHSNQKGTTAAAAGAGSAR